MAEKGSDTVVLVYLSGPMTGIPQNNVPMFNRVASYLRRSGFKVVNPAEIGDEATMSYDELIELDLKALRTCEAVFVMRHPKTPHSKGVAIEVAEANRLGIPVVSL